MYVTDRFSMPRKKFFEIFINVTAKNQLKVLVMMVRFIFNENIFSHT